MIIYQEVFNLLWNQKINTILLSFSKNYFVFIGAIYFKE